MGWLLPGSSRRRIFEAASRRIDDMKHGCGEDSALLNWARRSPRHVEAIFAVCNAWEEMAALTHEQRRHIERLARTASIEMRENESVVSLVGALHRQHGTPVRTWPLMASLAGIATLVAFAVIIQLSRYQPSPVYETGAGERRTIVLPDSSTVQLNSTTRLRIRFHDKLRDVELLEGEALFTVTHDPSRPFRVASRDSVVQAIGTEFDVQLSTQDTTVTVSAGRVAVFTQPVEHRATGGMERVDVAAAHAARFGHRNDDGRAVQVRAINAVKLKAQLAWTGAVVAFQGDSLSAAIATFNDSNTAQIVIDDPTLAGVTLAGRFYVNDPVKFVTALSALRIRFAVTDSADAPTFHLMRAEAAPRHARTPPPTIEATQ